MKKGKFTFISVITIVLVMVVAVAAVYFFGSYGDTEKETQLFTEFTTEISTEAPTQPPTQKDEIKTFIDDMTLEEKIAQMMLVSCHEAVDIESACSYGVGGLCLYYHSFDSKTADEVKSMTDSYQNLSEIPLLISTDEEGGTVVRVSANEQLRTVPFKSPSQLYAEGGFDLIERRCNCYGYRYGYSFCILDNHDLGLKDMLEQLHVF